MHSTRPLFLGSICLFLSAQGFALDTALPPDAQAALKVLQSHVAKSVATGKVVHADVNYGGVRDSAKLVRCNGDKITVEFEGALVLVGQATVTWKDVDPASLAKSAYRCVPDDDAQGQQALVTAYRALGIKKQGIAAPDATSQKRGTIPPANVPPPASPKRGPHRPMAKPKSDLPVVTRRPAVRGKRDPVLPQDHPYEKELYDWLNSLTMDDVTLNLADFTWDGHYQDLDQLASTWAILVNSSAYIDPTFIITGEPKWFTLDGIEGSGQVKQLRWGCMAAYWYQQTLPCAGGGQGNPYYRNPAVGRRALVATATDMMMYDHDMDRGKKCNNHYIGGAMLPWLYTYEHCREVLDPGARQAFEASFERMLDRILKWGLQDVCTNMCMRSVASAGKFYAITKDPSVKDKCVRAVRKLLFGYEDGSVSKCDSNKGAFYVAGYVGENDGPETTYNGVSHYHILEARAATMGDPKWDFLDPVLERMTEFAMYQRFRDPDGLVEGPSGYACRTGGSYVRWQRMRGWANATWADLYPEARPILHGRMKTPEAMVQQIQQRLHSKAMTAPDPRVPKTWVNDHSEHWQPDVPCTQSQGWYKRLYELDQRNDPSMFFPFARAGYTFNRPFGPKGAEEFWAYKNNDGKDEFGFFVEHVPRTWPYGSWAGGSLQAFWTSKTGILILCRHNFKDTGDMSTVEIWPTDHVWYRTATGEIFTTAKYYHHVGAAKVLGHFTGVRPAVEIEVGFGGGKKGKHSSLPGAGTVRTRFEATGNGIRVTKKLSGNGAGKVAEVWSTLPVFLCATGEGRKQSHDTTIEFLTGGTWKGLGTDLTETGAIRLGREFAGATRYGYIVFAAPQRVKLAPKVWLQTYQGSLRLRSLHMAFNTTAGKLPRNARIEYTIQTTPPPVQ